jgi:hypothetical protein
MCNYVILANNNKYCASSSCGQRHQLRFSLLVLHHQEQSITTQSGVEYSVNGGISVLEFICRIDSGNYTLYVRKLADATCVTFVIAYNYQRFNCCTCSNSLKRNTTYLRCANGNNSNNNANGIRYSLNGTLYQASNTFSSLTPNNYTLYVRI